MLGWGWGVGDGPGPETQSSVVLPQVDGVEEGTPRGMQRDGLRETGLSLHPGFLDRNHVIAMWFHSLVSAESTVASKPRIESE